MPVTNNLMQRIHLFIKSAIYERTIGSTIIAYITRVDRSSQVHNWFKLLLDMNENDIQTKTVYISEIRRFYRRATIINLLYYYY